MVTCDDLAYVEEQHEFYTKGIMPAWIWELACIQNPWWELYLLTYRGNTALMLHDLNEKWIIDQVGRVFPTVWLNVGSIKSKGQD